ncbi:MAG: winged helix-turn-helix domain-containing protein [Pseudohongiellaceae bacterium]|nr:winged helix-turn-helix domain-containing protein [Pseudohongiellaceae bacterium]
MTEIRQQQVHTTHASSEHQSVQDSFVLGNWTVAPLSNELRHRHNHERITLEPRLMQLLCMLHNQANEVVTRDRLNDGLWPHVIVNENSLTRAVSSLRRKLKPLHGPLALIETIPKKGYRLNTDALHTAESSSTSDVELPAVSALAIARKLLVKKWAQTSAMALSMSLGFAVALLSNSDNSIEFAAPAFLGDTVTTPKQFTWEGSRTRVENAVAQDLSSVSNTPSATAFSHDGKFFAFIKRQQESTAIMLGSLEAPEQSYEVFSTQDRIDHLQWAPTKRALLFAQSPRFSPAVLSEVSEEPSLVMLDLETLNTKVLDGPAINTKENTHSSEDNKPFNLT